jgi:hypothetical protein
VLCVPVSVAVAVLRYRLWDLDRLVSRGVTYLLLTGLLVLPYLLILPAATRLAGGVGNLAVAAATLAAAPFQPPRPGCRTWWTAASTDAARCRPHRGGVRGPAARAGRPGCAVGRAAGGGGADRGADHGVAVAAAAGQSKAAAVARPPKGPDDTRLSTQHPRPCRKRRGPPLGGPTVCAARLVVTNGGSQRHRCGGSSSSIEPPVKMAGP